MAMGKIKKRKLLYHLTRLSNLDSILEEGLVSRSLVKNKSIQFNDIADPEIICKRTDLGLSDYVPFHFHPYSSFDVAVKNTYAREQFIYICITREWAKQNNFKILPKHPLTHSAEEYKLYEYEEGFEAIDWVEMHTEGTQDTYHKNVKMAECLTTDIVPAKQFHCIYVKDEETKSIVENKLRSKRIFQNPPYVNVGIWF